MIWNIWPIFIVFGFIFTNIIIKFDHFFKDEIVFFKQVFIILTLFTYNFQRINLLLLSISLSHTLKAFVPYGCVLILLDVYILISTHR